MTATVVLVELAVTVILPVVLAPLVTRSTDVKLLLPAVAVVPLAALVEITSLSGYPLTVPKTVMSILLSAAALEETVTAELHGAVQ